MGDTATSRVGQRAGLDRFHPLICAIAETIVPNLERFGESSVWRNQASLHDTANRVLEQLKRLDAADQSIAIAFLNRLSMRGGTLAKGLPGKSFSELPPDRREATIKRLMLDRNRSRRWMTRSLVRMVLQASYLGTGTSASEDWKREYLRELNYETESHQVPARRELASSSTANDQSTFACHYLVIGSGAAGAVMAAELAETGRSVLLVDAGELLAPSELGMSESSAAQNILTSHGVWSTGENEVLVQAAQAMGGGTIASWGVCENPPSAVLRHWADHHGLKDVLTDEFEHSLFTVRRRLDVSNQTTSINRSNELLRSGLEKIGISTRVLERNAVDCSGCERCEFGCSPGARRDAIQTYLLDAQRLGVYLLPRCRVRRLAMRGDAANHAEAELLTDGGVRPVTLQFRQVVLCAGAIHSPAILLRSGIRARALGRHLHVHPYTAVNAFFAEPIHGWRGPAQSLAADFAARDVDYHGLTLDTIPVHPASAALALPWNSARHHRELMERLDHFVSLRVMCSDHGSGSVELDGNGNPRIRYRISSEDGHRMRSGVRLAVAALHHAGAATIFPPDWQSPGIDATRLDQSEQLKNWSRLIPDNDLPVEWKLFSAHLQSTCQFATSPTRGVVDGAGRVFGTRNVFVTDASILPTALGVNPMLTVTVMSHYLAQKVKALTQSG